MTARPAHDLEAALTQAIHNEARGTRMLRDNVHGGREHLIDAAQNYEDAGRPDDAARIRALIGSPGAPPAAQHEPAQEAPHEPEHDAGAAEHHTVAPKPHRRRVDK